MKVAICDDNAEVSKDLNLKLREVEDFTISECTIYKDPENLLFHIENVHYDIIFMDIKLNRRSGIDVADRVLKIDPETGIIFMSAYDDYYLDVYKVPHCYFLKKPLDMDRLREALSITVDRIGEMKTRYITFTKRHTAVRIPLSSIIYMEKNLRVVQIHMKDIRNARNLTPSDRDGEYTYRLYSKFDQLLPKMGNAFHQCHTSFVINFNHVSEVTGKSFIMDNGDEIPISEKYYYQIKSDFFKYIQGEI